MAVKLLTLATSVGVGPSWRIRAGALEHTVQCTATGNPTSVITELEGSLDGDIWYQLAAHSWSSSEIAAQAAMFHVSTKLVTHVRINLTTLVGGSSPSITCLYEALEF
jgi:hypothetical protein